MEVRIKMHFTRIKNNGNMYISIMHFFDYFYLDLRAYRTNLSRKNQVKDY